MAAGKVKILVADDDAEMRASLARVLSSYEVLQAADGEQALRLAAEEKPALVLLDVNMPALNGLQVLERLQAFSRGPLVVMLTAETGLETAVKAISLGAYAYLTKPLEADRVKETAAAAAAEYARRNSPPRR